MLIFLQNILCKAFAAKTNYRKYLQIL